MVVESLFMAACHGYVLSVYLLLHLFVWQNIISSSSSSTDALLWLQRAVSRV